jgi:hypothetical protein
MESPMPRLRLLAFLSLATIATAAPVPKPKAQPPVHPTAVGTRWEYTRSGTTDTRVEEVTESHTADGVTTFKVQTTFDGKDTGVDTLTLTGGVVSVVAHSAAGTYSPTRLLWPTAATAGSVLETTWALGTGVGRPHQQTETLTVGKAEAITTPAGTFTATPITRTMKGLNEGTVLWYAEGVGLVRHTEPGSPEPIQELKAFTPGKK